jgi:hypothetical protein
MRTTKTNPTPPYHPQKEKSLDPLDAWLAGLIGRQEFLCIVCFVYHSWEGHNLEGHGF